MGLSDIYYQRPVGPADDVQRRTDAAFDQLARVPLANAQLRAQQLQNDYQQQQNIDQQYTSPAAPASDASNAIGQHILAQLRGTPGHNSEFEQRLLGELQGGGLGARPGAPQAPATGLGVMSPQQPVQNLGQQTGYQGYTPPGAGGQEPGMPQVTVSREPMAANGEPMRRPLNASRSFAMDRVDAQQAQVPQVQVREPPRMTNGDVDRAMRLSPFLRLQQEPKQDPRMAIALLNDQREREKTAGNDKLQRDRMAQRQRFLDQEDALKRELARLQASVSLTNGNAAQKAILAQMKMVNDLRIANLKAKAQQTSGLGGIVYDQQTQAAMAQEDANDQAALQQAEQLQQQLDAALANGAGQSRGGRATVSGPQGDVRNKYRPGQVIDGRRLTRFNEQTGKWDWEPAP